MKTWRRIAILWLACLTVGGLRAVLPEDTAAWAIFQAQETVTGTCGENLTWSFDGVSYDAAGNPMLQNGTLTVSGSGAMDHADSRTISNKYTDETYPTGTFSGTIYGSKGSTAEAYANKYGYSISEQGSGSEPESDLPEAPAGSIYGDVDCDRDITLNDAQYVLPFYVERMTGNARSWRAVTGSEQAPG